MPILFLIRNYTLKPVKARNIAKNTLKFQNKYKINFVGCLSRSLWKLLEARKISNKEKDFWGDSFFLRALNEYEIFIIDII